MMLFLPCLLVNIVRKEIFQKQYKFTGSLTDDGGTNIQTQTEKNYVVKTAAL